jgi:elongation factor P hydroxylase
MCDVNDLVRIFDDLFANTFNTQLVAGGEEPVYLPATPANERHRLVFSHDYFSSALHEISHWCIAGSQRRTLVDFGYWYAPDGRSLQQQQEFEEMEIKPQALEWFFSMASGIKFRVSVDNLNAGEYDSSLFAEQVCQQVLGYLDAGLPLRAERFAQQLLALYQEGYGYADFCEDMKLTVAAANNAGPVILASKLQQLT